MAKFGEGKEGGRVPSIDFPKGGDGKMFGKGGARPAVAGVSGKETNSGEGEWPKGGSTKMFGKGHANKAESGQSGKTSQ
jgi:hypothetical protein